MLKALIATLFFAITLNFSTFGQQRIGMDVSTRMDNLMFTFHYQKVMKKRFLLSAGIFVGGNGKTFVSNDTLRLYTGTPIRSPYANANEPVIDSTGTYSILDYRASAASVGVQFGIGYFHEFDVQHGLRVNLNSTWGFAGTAFGAYYRSTENYTERYKSHYIEHFVSSISLEAFHTIRLSGRLTFNYGLKFPYYFTIDKAKFNPLVNRDILYGFEPQLSVGLTRVIGKCD